jgi:hypothetical protein
MDEARRFLRYVIPGVAFIVQTLLILWILIPDWTLNIIAKLRADTGIGIVIAALFGSGGIGFIFSTVHHVILWQCRSRWFTGPLDHRGLIDRLRSRNVLCLLDPQNGVALPASLKPDRFEAWAIVAALWHERIATSKWVSKKIKSAEPRSDSLANLVHSLGAARVASIVAVILAFAIFTRNYELPFETWRFIITGVIVLALLYFYQTAYWQAGLAAQRVVEQVLTDALVDEFKASGRPVKTYVVLENKKAASHH